LTPEAVKVISEALKKEFGDKNVVSDEYEEKGGIPDFPVVDRNEEVASSQSISAVLTKIPQAVVGFVFINPDFKDEARKWLEENKLKILEKAKREVKYE